MAILQTAPNPQKSTRMLLVESRIGEPVEGVLVRLLNQGKQQKEIAELLGIERSTVSRWVKDFGIRREVGE